MTEKKVTITEAQQQKLVKITGTLTSQIQLKGENAKESYHYAFININLQRLLSHFCQ